MLGGLSENGLTRARLTRSADRGTILVKSSRSTRPDYGVYDTDTDSFLTVSPLDHGAHTALSPDGSAVAFEVSSAWPGIAPPGSPITDRSFTVGTQLPSNDVPVAFDPVRPLLYSINVDTDRVSAYDTGTWEKRFDFPADNNPEPSLANALITVADDGSALFVADLPHEGRPFGRFDGNLRMYPLVASPTITGMPDSVRAGRPVPITVTVRDLAGNVVPDFTGTVVFRSTDPAAVLPPPLTFTAANGGVRTTSVMFNTSSSFYTPHSILTAVDVATGASGSVDGFTVDGLGVVAEVMAPPNIDSTYFDGRVGITFDAATGIDLTTLGDDDIIIRAFDGTELPVRMTSSAPRPDLSTGEVEVGYEFKPRGQAWEANDNGTYTVSLREGAVSDLVGNASAAAELSTFTVELEAWTRGNNEPIPDPVVYVSVPGTEGVRTKSFFRGKTVNAVVTVNNFGYGVLTGGDYELVLNGPGDYAVVLDSGPRSFNVGTRGGFTKFSTRVKLPADAPRGMYSLSAGLQVDGEQGGEINDNVGSSATFGVTDGGGPLGAPSSDISADEAYVALVPGGRPQTVRLRLGAGELPIRGEYKLRLQGSLVAGGGTPVVFAELNRRVTLQARQTKTFSFRVTLPADRPAGDYYLRLTAEPAVALG